MSIGAIAFRCLSIGAVVLAGASSSRAQNAVPPAGQLIVVELYTSQGCDSCPPADALMGELAARADILALSLHVDYWDYLGWKDPYAQRAFSDRQRAYSRALAQRFVYTPQMIVDGRVQEIGSDRKAIEHAIAKARQQAVNRPVLRQVGKGAGAAVMIDELAGADASRSRPATVWLVLFDRMMATAITRGELAGRTVSSFNIVREWKRAGYFTGEALTIAVDLTRPGHDQGSAVIVQSGTAGPILAALPLETR